MGTAIGDLVMRMSANTKPFDSSMRRSRSVMGRLGGGARFLRSGLMKLAGGFAAVAGVGAMGFMIKQQFTLIDRTAKLSDQLGIQTEKLIGLRHAAEITGAGSAKLDKSLQVMSKNLGEGLSGAAGEAKDALKAIGLDAADLASKKPDEAFRIIADRVAGLGTQFEKTYVASKIFGRGGLDIVNMLALGSAGLDKMQADAERLGMTYSRLDAAKVEEANDAMQRMKSAVGGVFGRVAIAMAPAVQKVADGLTDLVPKIINFASYAKAAFVGIGAKLSTLTPVLLGLLLPLGIFVAHLALPLMPIIAIGVAIGVVGKYVLKLVRNWDETNDAVTRAARQAWAFATNWDRVSSAIADVAASTWAGIRVGVSATVAFFKQTWQRGLDWMSGTFGAVGSLVTGRRVKAETSANDAIERARRGHADRVTAIGVAMADDSKAWKARLGDASGFANSFTEGFKTIVDNLDVMLGSWEGFRAGVVNIGLQTWYALEIGIEQTASFFRIKWEEAKAWFGATWHAMGEVGVKNVMPALSRMFIWFRKKAAEMRGEKWLLTAEDEAGIIKADQARVLDELKAKRIKAEVDANKAIAKIREDAEKKYLAIGEKSIAQTDKWEAQKKKGIRLSDKARDAWEKMKAAVGADETGEGPGGPEPPPEMLPPGEEAAAPKFAAAAQKGTAAAYSQILASLQQPKNAEDKIAKNTERMASNSDEQLAIAKRGETRDQETVEMPGVG